MNIYFCFSPGCLSKTVSVVFVDSVADVLGGQKAKGNGFDRNNRLRTISVELFNCINQTI